jgi:hypothetical protein
MNAIIALPTRLEQVLDGDQIFANKIWSAISPFSDILKANQLYFFPEYTDHGIKHIENTLTYVENLISEDTFAKLTPKEVGIIVLSVVLHDIGMHTNAEMFRNMIEGRYDSCSNLFGKKTWKEIWEMYIEDSKYWNQDKKENVFGEPDHIIERPDLSDLQKLNEYDKKFIGEFIRQHHCRVAHEIAINGYIGKNTISFGKELDTSYLEIAGVVARSHGMNVRDTFDYLEELTGTIDNPLGIHAVYLMVLLRLADYLQIDNERTNETLLSIKSMYSPFSRMEHATHLSIKNIQFENKDKERILVHADPKDARLYVKIEELVEDIQKEFDLSWAILGEVYTHNDYKLRYRRITTNISNERYRNGRPYIPKRFGFRFNNELTKLLIAPLYGDDPKYGVRELVQNAVDACRECMKTIKYGEAPHVVVELDTKKSLFTVTDTGKGMTIDEIENYFLTIGSSYNNNVDWKKERDQKGLYRTGRFGIGVLAAFLLGPEIAVTTRSRKEGVGYTFKASLDDKFIQVDKVKEDIPYGTKIEIKCNCAGRLLRESKYSKNHPIEYPHFWHEWYIDEEPKVAYFCNGSKLSPRAVLHDLLKGYKELKHNAKGYGPIYWKPRPVYDNSSNKHLFCNGFFISNDSNKKGFSTKGMPLVYPMRIPDLQITDIYNELPLNLRRDNIDYNVIYDFEEDLKRDVNIDIICQFMAVDIRKKMKFNLRDFYFSSLGFALRKIYENGFLSGKQIVNIGIVSEIFSAWKKCESIFKEFPDTLFYFRIESLDYLTEKSKQKKICFRSKLSPNASFAIYYGEKISEFELRKDIVKGYENKVYPYKDCLIYDPKLKNKTVFDAILDIMAPSYIFIEEAPTNFSFRAPKIGNPIIDEYMNHPVIPFDMEERKKQFPLIHQQYGDVIEQYKKKFERDK